MARNLVAIGNGVHTHTHTHTHTVNPLVVSLEGTDTSGSKRTSLWFSKSEFSSLDNDQDEDMELQQMMDHYKTVGGRVVEESESQDDAKDEVQSDLIFFWQQALKTAKFAVFVFIYC